MTINITQMIIYRIHYTIGNYHFKRHNNLKEVRKAIKCNQNNGKRNGSKLYCSINNSLASFKLINIHNIY